MKIIKADNYQTWYIESHDSALIIDPWLTKKLKPNNEKFIQRTKSNISCLKENEKDKIIGIIVTAPFDDHLHIESLDQFDKKIPIYTSKIVRKKIKKIISNPIYLLSQKVTKIGPFDVKSLPTSYPYYSTTFSLLIEDYENNKVFHEGHIVNFKYMKKNNIKTDVAILTAEEVKLFGIIGLGMNYKNAIKACKILNAKTLFITGNRPDKTKGFISNFLSTKTLPVKKLSKNINLLYKEGDQYTF